MLFLLLLLVWGLLENTTLIPFGSSIFLCINKIFEKLFSLSLISFSLIFSLKLFFITTDLRDKKGKFSSQV